MKKLVCLSALTVLSSVNAASFNGYIVKLKNGSSAFTQKAFQNTGVVKKIDVSFGNFVSLQTDASLDSKSMDSIRNNPDVEYVEPNYIYKINPIKASEFGKSISDKKYAQQWGLKNTGKNSGGWFSPGKKGEDLNAEKAWGITKGNKEIIVAIIDTGIDYNHPDLKDNLWVNDAELNGEANVDDDGNGYIDDVYGYDFANGDADPLDGHGHGTHCAGNIGAVHNSIGVRGMMKDVRLMGLKFLTDKGSGETIGAIKSIDYAIKNGANIMSNSWGGGGRSKALKEAIQAASDEGILFVAAAGNSKMNNDTTDSFPANYKVDNVITVGAMNGKGGRSSFSNYGASSVHVFAPGSNILSTVKNGGYKKMSGTSMATPFVAGALGLLLAHEPGITVLEAKERLIKTTIRNRSLKGKAIGGRVDTYRMLLDVRD